MGDVKNIKTTPSEILGELVKRGNQISKILIGFETKRGVYILHSDMDPGELMLLERAVRITVDDIVEELMDDEDTE